MGVPNTFTNGTTADADEVNENFTNIENYLGYAQTTTSQSSITTETDLTNLSVTVTVPSGGRKIRITGQILVASSAAADQIEMSIKENTTYLNKIYANISSVGQGHSVTGQYIGTATAGSHTYKLALKRNAGSGTLTMTASSTIIAFILVEQI